jgi:hypothetical protein
MSSTPSEAVPTTPPTGSRAVVPTDRGRRYGKQLAAHLGRRLTTSWDDETGTGLVSFDRGRCEMTATDEQLVLQVVVDSAADTNDALEQLNRMEDVVGRHLVRFGTRDELVATWVRSDGSAGLTHRVADEDPADNQG